CALVGELADHECAGEFTRALALQRKLASPYGHRSVLLCPVQHGGYRTTKVEKEHPDATRRRGENEIARKGDSRFRDRQRCKPGKRQLGLSLVSAADSEQAATQSEKTTVIRDQKMACHSPSSAGCAELPGSPLASPVPAVQLNETQRSSML